jgi:Ca2+-binding RTX toxin-like protein
MGGLAAAVPSTCLRVLGRVIAGLLLAAAAIPLLSLEAVAVPRGCTVTGTNGPDDLLGSPGNTGDDVLCGLGGNDHMDGNGGNDILYGGSGIDQAYGGGGNDQLFGGDNKDSLGGGLGKDVLHGGAGRDAMSGSYQHDELRGGPARDYLHDTHGHDVLMGGNGRDCFYAADGHPDVVLGGPGSDTATVDGEDIVHGVEHLKYVAPGGPPACGG